MNIQPRTGLLLLLSCLLFAGFFQSCAPLSEPTGPTSEEMTADRARLASLRKQLQELQEELARVKAEPPRQPAPAVSAATPAWDALSPDKPPAEAALYACLLSTPASGAQDVTSLLTVVETLPGPAETTSFSRNLILVPFRGETASGLQTNSIDTDYGRKLLADLGEAIPRLDGPLLVISRQFPPGPTTPAVIIDLAGRRPTFSKAALQQFQGFPAAEPQGSTDLSSLLPQLIALAGTEPTRVSLHDRAWVVTWSK